MSQKLIFTGTCGSSWLRVVEHFTHLCESSEPSGLLAVNTGPFFLHEPSASLSQLMVAREELRIVAFCEPPASVLASGSAKTSTVAFQPTLDAWSDSAENLLALWRKHRNRVHLLDWSECCACPREFRDWLQNAHSLMLECPSGSLESEGMDFDAVRHLLYEGVVKGQSRPLRLWREIQAACQPLSSTYQSEQTDFCTQKALDSLAHAESLYNALLADCDKLVSEKSALDSQLVTLDRQREALSADLLKHKEHAERTNETLLLEIQEAFEESEVFFSELQTARGEIEKLNEDLQSLRNERDVVSADLQRQKDLALQTNETLLLKIQEAFEESEGFFSELQTARGEIEKLNEDLQSLRNERDVVSADLQRQKDLALQTNEMLLSEIHSAHLESERFFEEWKTLEAATDFHHLQVGSVARGQERTSPTHRHLDFSFERVELLGRRWPHLAVRLVEHNGNAGLAIFDSPDQEERPLFHWKQSGEERGTGYMLLVPHDKPALKVLVALPTTDLVLLRCLASRILGNLSVYGESPTKRWSTVARRFLKQLEEIPARLHYDSVRATPAQGPKEKDIDFTATNLFFGGSIAENFRCSWHPGVRGGEIILRKADRPAHIFFGLPADQDAICIKRDYSGTSRGNCPVWSGLLERDRQFIRLLVAALPDFIFHLCEQHPEQMQQQSYLQSQAKLLRREISKLRSPETKRNPLSKIFAR